MVAAADILVKPNTLTDLTAVDSYGNTATLSDFTKNPSGFYMEIGSSGQKLQCGNITFSSTGYNTQTVNCYTDTTHTIVMESASVTITLSRNTSVDVIGHGNLIDSNTLYNITDDNDVSLSVLQTIYPVGSLYLTTNATCPLANLFGSWELVSQDRVLQGAGSRGAVGTTINESLPAHKHTRGTMNITGWVKTGSLNFNAGSYGGALSNSSVSGSRHPDVDPDQVCQINLDASKSWTGSTSNPDNSTYQDNAPVQQNAYLINVYRRTA